MKISKSALGHISFSILFILFTVVLYSSQTVIDVKLNTLSAMSLISLILFICSKSIPLISISWFTILFLYLYNFGQVWLVLCGIELKSGSFKITQYSNEELCNAIVYALIVINVLQIAIIAFKKVRKPNNLRSKSPNIRNSALYITTLLFFAFCIVILTYNDIVQIVTARSVGYLLAFSIGRNNSIVQAAIYLFPLVMCLMVFQTSTRIRKIILIYVIFRCLLMMVLVGNRGQYIAMLTIVILFISNEYINISKKNSIKQYVVFIICGFFLVVVAGYVANTRNIVDSHESIYTMLTNNNIIFQVLNELGSTLINTVIAIKVIPGAIDFGKGISYVGTIIQFIPGMSLIFPQSIKYNDLGGVFNSYFAKKSGLGGSYIAEMYFNFGWMALIVQFVFGWILSKIDSSIINKDNFILQKSVMYFYGHAIFMYIRGNFSDYAVYTRMLLYFFIVYMLLKQFAKKK